MQGIVNESNTPTVLFEQESMVEQIEHLAASVPSRPANVEYLPPMTIAHVNSEMIMAEMASETPKENPLAVKYTGPEITAQTAVPAAATSGRENSMHTSKGILSLSELKSLEVLRMEFASSAFKPKVILSYESISFNKACVKLLPGIRYVNVLIDRHKKRIIILPVNEHAKDALRWCGITRDGDVRKRLCTAKKFGEKLYEMMQWIKENKYRILAYYQEIEGVQLLVFNLRECEMVVPDFVTTKTGKVIKRGRVYLPGEWENGFGMPLLQHNEANAVELDAHYTLSDKDMPVTISDIQVQGRIPAEEEMIMSQYRKEK